MVRECFAAIVTGKTEPRHIGIPFPEERPLSDIKQDMLEYTILEQTSHLRPRVYIKSRSEADVRYEEFMPAPSADSVERVKNAT